MSKKRDINWPAVWKQVSDTMVAQNAPKEVADAVGYTEWLKDGDKFILMCTRALYEWMEVPASASEESNLRYIKPILWPAVQRLGCKTLIYKIL